MEKNEMINKTIFDFNPTKEEIEDYACNMSRERYVQFFSVGTRILHLLYMLHSRNDERYKHFLELVDDEDRFDFCRLILH